MIKPIPPTSVPVSAEREKYPLDHLFDAVDAFIKSKPPNPGEPLINATPIEIVGKLLGKKTNTTDFRRQVFRETLTEDHYVRTNPGNPNRLKPLELPQRQRAIQPLTERGELGTFNPHLHQTFSENPMPESATGKGEFQVKKIGYGST